jgi:hypothetical protein
MGRNEETNVCRAMNELQPHCRLKVDPQRWTDLTGLSPDDRKVKPRIHIDQHCHSPVFESFCPLNS